MICYRDMLLFRDTHICYHFFVLNCHPLSGSIQSTNPIYLATCQQPKPPLTDCGRNITRLYFNAATENCESFQYKGYGGNSDRFHTEEACQNRCGGCQNLDSLPHIGLSKLYL